MPFVPTVAAGQIISSSAWGNLVGPQTVMRFTTAAQRTSQLTAPVPNQLTMLDTAPGQLDYWTGSAWAPVGGVRELSYTQITANKIVAATVETGADAVIQAPAVAFDGSPVLIETFAAAVLPPVAAGAYLMFWLFQDGVSIGRLASVIDPAAVQTSTPVYALRRLTPTAGNHAYTLGATVSGATGTVAAGAGGAGNYSPAFLRITRAT